MVGPRCDHVCRTRKPAISAVTIGIAQIGDSQRLRPTLAVTFASRPATPTRTFGYYRLEILAAVINAVLLFGVAAFILIEAWRRWTEPPQIEGGLMLAFASVGLVVNIIGLLLLRSGSNQSL